LLNRKPHAYIHKHININ